MTLDWRPTREGVRFTGWGSRPLPPFPLEGNTSDDLPRTVWFLQDLWGRNLLERVSGSPSALLPWQWVFALEPHEHALLGLPEVNGRLRASVETDLYLSASGFRMRADFTLEGAPRRSFGDESRVGLIFNLPDGPALPPRDISELILLLDQPLGASVHERGALVAKVRRLAEKSERITLDEYLLKTDCVLADRIGVDVTGVSPEEVRLRARVEGVQEDAFRGLVGGPARSMYTQFLPDGQRRRLVLRPNQVDAVRHLRSKGTLRGADIPEFFANPEAYLPDEIEIDPSEFSMRVRGLAPIVYRSQPYISLSANKRRGWFDAGPTVKIEREDEDLPGGRASRSDTAAGGGTSEIPPDEFRELADQADRDGARFVKFRDGWIEIDPERSRSFIDFLDDNPAVDDTGRRLLDGDGRQYVLDVFPNTETLQYAEPDSGPFGSKIYEVPRSLSGKLHGYQKLGYSWMRRLHERRLGGLLADEMGLGKTVQIIAFMSYLHEIGKLRPALIVAPVAVIVNWQRELRKFAPLIQPAFEHRGSQREKRDPNVLAQHEVVITSYATLRSDQLMLGKVDWSMVACDEAQYVKNPTARVTSAVKGMKAGLRLACTGTPVENGLSELWCIVDFAQPGRLGSRSEFRQEFEAPMVDQVGSESDSADLVARLRKRLNPHFVRRTKEEVLDLPEKNERSYEVPMGIRQAQMYSEVLAGLKGREFGPLSALHRLLSICSHPALMDDVIYENPRHLLNDCPKLEEAVRIVGEVRDQRDKVVIYTRYKKMQRILQVALRSRFGIELAVLNGLVPGYRRHSIVEAFNASPGFNALIISPEAAGIGMNITGATHVIHYTRLWNPAKENQATDRVHRIGQERPVTVHYPIVKGEADAKSVEEHLHDLLTEKLRLARNVLVPKPGLDVRGELEKSLMQHEGIRADRSARASRAQAPRGGNFGDGSSPLSG